MPLKVFTIPTFVAALTLSACSPALEKGPEALGNSDISVRTPDARLMRQDAVNFFREQPVLHLQTDVSNTFHLKTEIGGEVPPVTLQRVNAAPDAVCRTFGAGGRASVYELVHHWRKP